MFLKTMILQISCFGTAVIIYWKHFLTLFFIFFCVTLFVYKSVGSAYLLFIVNTFLPTFWSLTTCVFYYIVLIFLFQSHMFVRGPFFGRAPVLRPCFLLPLLASLTYLFPASLYVHITLVFSYIYLTLLVPVLAVFWNCLVCIDPVFSSNFTRLFHFHLIFTLWLPYQEIHVPTPCVCCLLHLRLTISSYLFILTRYHVIACFLFFHPDIYQ